MTPEQLKAVKIGDDVTLRDVRGRITQVQKNWFGVMWADGVFEPINRRHHAILISRLHLETK